MRHTTAALRLLPALLLAFGLASGQAQTRTNTADAAYWQAAQLHKDGRFSAAYGRFVSLANDGDPDAARIALFMHRYGPMLYGSHWDISTEEAEYWSLLATRRGRADPVFQPAYAQAPVVVKVNTVRRPGRGVSIDVAQARR